MNVLISDYLTLMRNFSTGVLSAGQFEEKFLNLFKSDISRRPEKEFTILDKLFADVDAFCADPEIRDEEDLSEDDLRQSVLRALRDLEG